jgi:hypothetical protein
LPSFPPFGADGKTSLIDLGSAPPAIKLLSSLKVLCLCIAPYKSVTTEYHKPDRSAKKKLAKVATASEIP